MARKRRLSQAIDKEKNSLKFEEMKESVIKNKLIEGVKPSTIRNYNKAFSQFGEYLDGINVENLLDLNEENAKDFVYFLIKKELQTATVNTYIRYIKSAYNTIFADNETNNIFKKIKQLKTDEKPIDVLTLDDIKSILKVMDLESYTEFRDYVLLHVLIDTFCRRGEALGLTKDDVDLTNQTVTFKNTKSRKIRTIPISKKTSKLLKKLIDETKEFESDNIFLSWNGKAMENSGRQFSTKLKDYAKRAGINKRIHPHLFRHSASAHFLKETGNIRVLQKILGHSDISITQRYSHVLDSTVYDLHEKHSIINVIDTSSKRKTKIK